MASFLAMNDVLLAATPTDVWAALMDEFAGRERFLGPTWTWEPLDGPPAGALGAVCRVTTRPATKLPNPIRFRIVGRVDEVEAPYRIVASLLEGSFLGTITFELDQAGPSTRLRVTLDARPGTRGVRILGALTDLAKGHSKAGEVALAGLQDRFVAGGDRST